MLWHTREGLAETAPLTARSQTAATPSICPSKGAEGHVQELGVLLSRLQVADRAQVPVATHVVRGREDCEAAVAFLPLVAVAHYLVRADAALQAVLRAEALGHVRPEEHAGAPGRLLAPGLGAGVRPEDVHGDAPSEVTAPTLDVVEVAQLHAFSAKEPAMQDENGAVDHGGQGQTAEGLLEALKDFSGVLFQDLLLESIDPVHGRRLVVPAVQQQDPGVRHGQCQQNEDDLHRVTTAVHEVAIEEEVILAMLRHSTDLQHSQELRELAVQVANHM
mmetsp:Transcript_118500/g.347128  ORF Transcript_118500/g.347128 Transcript_118500/m.347128 type:complete len:276 (-) Transcript_118500:224-1051(-)